MNKIKYLPGYLRAGFWFLPSLIAALCMARAVGLAEVARAARVDDLAQVRTLL